MGHWGGMERLPLCHQRFLWAQVGENPLLCTGRSIREETMGEEERRLW